MNNEFVCKLTPLGDYFLGGEQRFEWEGEKGGKSPYFIQSKLLPSQPTLLGIVRYCVLEANGQLDGMEGASKGRQKDLVGEKGFVLKSNLEVKTQYGCISSIGPLLIETPKNEIAVPIPFNHQVKNQTKNNHFTPFEMGKLNFSDLGSDKYIPIDFVAKDGISDNFLNLKDNTVIPLENIFEFQERTRIAIAKQRKDGFFKKRYVVMKEGYHFLFSVSFDDSDEKIENLKDYKSIVYVGQEKSAFSIEFVEKTEEYLPAKITVDKASSVPENHRVICLLTDAYIPNTFDMKSLSFYSTQGELVRTLTYQNTDSHEVKYREKKQRSELFSLYRKGSVFYEKEECDPSLLKVLENETAMRQIGYNYYLIMEVKK